MANLPNIQQRPAHHHVSHRRGLSLDTRRQHQPIMASPATRTPLRQDFSTVSTTTNPGLPTTPQHALREAQQQRTARPGPGHQQHPYAVLATGTDEGFLLSPQGTPHSQRFDAACFDGVSAGPQQDCMGIPYDAYGGQISLMIKKNQGGFANNMAGSYLDLDHSDSALSTPTFMTFDESTAASQGWMSEGETASTRRTSRRISNGIMDRVSKFENMGADGLSRPVTPPPHQNANNYFPPTPKETPHDRMAGQEARTGRFSDDYDESMEETLKPARGSRSNRSSGIFQDMRQQAEGVLMPQRANTMPMGMTTQDFMNMSNVNAEFMKIEHGFGNLAPSAETFHMAQMAQQQQQQQQQQQHHSNPTTPHHLVGPAFDNKPDLRPPDFEAQVSPYGHLPHSPTHSAAASRRGSPHRRTESLASIASAASIASLNIEETKTDTGVTLDDIAAYITGPDAGDGKWQCLFDGCGKRFGRKENIKSHVQTHLNDRQFQCPSCHKCFVRQHDLKRHAKIHTGIKPYPCDCGNSFARHDALTRHRQRGMCIGAFDGIVRKVVKRGRPRKHRPDMAARVDKSARTRTKNRRRADDDFAHAAAAAAASSPSATSQSGYSDSSAPNSPGGVGFDDVLDGDGFPDLMDVAMTGVEDGSSSPSTTATMNPSALAVVSSAPMPTLSMAPDLAEVLAAAHAHARSPSVASHYSHRSRLSLTGGDDGMTLEAGGGLPPHGPASPARSVASHYTSHHVSTPPELSASSSPPSSAAARYFDLADGPGSGGCAVVSTMGGLSAPLTVTAGIGCGGGMGGGGVDVGNLSSSSLEEDLLKAFTTDADVLVQLDGSGLGMLSSKFDEEYGMFTNGDDVFFGSS